MTAGLMRKLARVSLARSPVLQSPSPAPASSAFGPLVQPHRSLANLSERDDVGSQLWFNSTAPASLPAEAGGLSGGLDHKPPDERTLKLGNTIRVLHERLPTLLNSPLPQEILSPQITLHLFPSTHPHLPTVSGKIGYMAALWTAPMAWGRVPVVGNVKLIILSERMVRNGGTSVHFRSEKLIVRWKTCGKTKGKGMGALYRGISGSEQVDKITEFLGGHERDDAEFTGLFIFEFDEDGRIVTHTIEHAEERGSWDKTTKVISVTDWLLGKAWGKKSEDEGAPGLALGCYEANQEQRKHMRVRR